jgi:hypothetical protein
LTFGVDSGQTKNHEENRMDAKAQYRIDLLQNRIKELEAWQEKARQDIARMEQAIVALAEPRSTTRDLGEAAAMEGLVYVR